jgi:hypothetical protein
MRSIVPADFICAMPAENALASAVLPVLIDERLAGANYAAIRLTRRRCKL